MNFVTHNVRPKPVYRVKPDLRDIFKPTNYSFYKQLNFTGVKRTINTLHIRAFFIRYRCKSTGGTTYL